MWLSGWIRSTPTHLQDDVTSIYSLMYNTNHFLFVLTQIWWNICPLQPAARSGGSRLMTRSPNSSSLWGRELLFPVTMTHQQLTVSQLSPVRLQTKALNETRLFRTSDSHFWETICVTSFELSPQLKVILKPPVDVSGVSWLPGSKLSRW